MLADHLGLEEEDEDEEEDDEEVEEEEEEEEEKAEKKRGKEKKKEIVKGDSNAGRYLPTSSISASSSTSLSSSSSTSSKSNHRKGTENQNLSDADSSEEEVDFGLGSSAKPSSRSDSISIPRSGAMSGTSSRSVEAPKKILPMTSGGFSLIEFQYNKLAGSKSHIDLSDLISWVFIQVSHITLKDHHFFQFTYFLAIIHLIS